MVIVVIVVVVVDVDVSYFDFDKLELVNNCLLKKVLAHADIALLAPLLHTFAHFCSFFSAAGAGQHLSSCPILKKIKMFSWFVLGVVAALQPAAALRFSSVFGSHMVLQRDVKAAVYGSGAPNTHVTLTGSGGLDKLKGEVIVAPDGAWKLLFDQPYPAGTVGSVTATSGGSTVTLSDLVFGDVYFCSG